MDTKPKKSFNLNFDDITFKTNWPTLTAIVTLLVFSISLYVDNQNKDERINRLEKIVIVADSLSKKNDEEVSELLKATIYFTTYDEWVFYKDVYFDNKFRELDGKPPHDFTPKMLEFYESTKPESASISAPGSRPPGN